MGQKYLYSSEMSEGNVRHFRILEIPPENFDHKYEEERVSQFNVSILKIKSCYLPLIQELK